MLLFFRRHRLCRLPLALFAALALSACSTPPPAPVVVSEPAPARAVRDPADVTRIDELQRQLAEAQRLLVERRRQAIGEAQRLERELKETRARADELQGKLDAILEIDRDLRRGSKGSE